MYGKDQKHLRRCMERTRSTPEDALKVTTEAVHVRSRKTAEAVWKGPEVLQKMYGK
jgi:hypothetical protein